MAKMNPEIKARWVAALRSGEYQQAREHLRDGDGGGYCCLGVLCDLYRKERGAEWDDSQLREAEDIELPSKRVYRWAGIDNPSPGTSPTVTIDEVTSHLSNHNDAGRVFAQIADAIEAQL